MNNEEKTIFVNNLKKRFPIKSSSKMHQEKKETIEFWTGERSFVVDNRLTGKEYEIPLKDTHILLQYGHGCPIEVCVPRCRCEKKKTNY